METKYLYKFKKDTGEYIGSGGEAKLDPLDKKPMQPGGTTFKAPPQVQAGEVAVFEGDPYRDGSWVVKKDERGTYYDTETLQEVEHKELDEKVPAKLTKVKPVEEYGSLQYFEDGEWKFQADIYREQMKDSFRGVCINKYNMGVLDEIPPNKGDLREAIRLFNEDIVNKKTKKEMDTFFDESVKKL